MSSEEKLICAIFEQAIEDYKTLKSKRIQRKTEEGLTYSVREIENFFKSGWSSFLLDAINSDLKGRDVLGKVKSQCYQTEAEVIHKGIK